MAEGITERPANEDGEPTGASGKPVVIAIVAVGLLVSVYFALGMPGMDHGAHAGATMSAMDGHAAAHVVDPSDFERLLDRPEVVLVNVHQPYEGEIAGTDAFLSFENPDPTGMPVEKSTPLAIYCRTGHMSDIAAGKLHELGYTNITELAGGMEAWKASGRPLVDRTKNG